MKALLLFVLISASLVAQAPNCNKIMQEIQRSLPRSGVLRQDLQRFVYVDLDTAYVDRLLPYIQKEGFDRPPYFGDSLGGKSLGELRGSRIAVIYPDESAIYNLTGLEEIGRTVPFKVKSCETIFVGIPGYESAYILTVDSPYLDQLRQKYNLPAKRMDYHIVIGMKAKKVELPNAPATP